MFKDKLTFATIRPVGQVFGTHGEALLLGLLLGAFLGRIAQAVFGVSRAFRSHGVNGLGMQCYTVVSLANFC